ncbi:MAG: phenylalanine--tRNA ligase subunit alpha [Myxococcales bacterium]|nr:MAG: phenylalanine--tRNA ligase subunit alpha [Myxococcales bacterium]
MNPNEAVTQCDSSLQALSSSFENDLRAAQTEQELRRINARYAGSKGELTSLLKLIPKLPTEKRREYGQKINQLKQQIEAAFSAQLQSIAEASKQADLQGPALDVSLPGKHVRPGSEHPITRTRNALVDVFVAMGFNVADGPEIELEKYNFEMLGFPPDHPATDMQDSFFVSGGGLLRTHTSTIQVREMLKHKPPLAVVAPGAVYRRDDDATHSPMFFQIEGLLVDKNITFAHLKGTLRRFVDAMFGPDIPVRFRPSYYPFVEPGAEMDIGCVLCHGKSNVNCRVCKNTGWLEVLGCGMVHPVVFEHVGYDPELYTGFAFGMGIDRIAMLRHGIDNIRLLYENDERFLRFF